jgi:hypothetical protein
MLRNHLVVVAMLGLGLYAIVSRVGRRMPAPNREPARIAGGAMRPPSPRQMKDRPGSWDMTDERADESFPASDPPGTY